MNEEHSHDSLRDIVWDNVPAQETEHVPFRQRNGTVLSSLSQKLHVIESGSAPVLVTRFDVAEAEWRAEQLFEEEAAKQHRFDWKEVQYYEESDASWQYVGDGFDSDAAQFAVEDEDALAMSSLGLPTSFSRPRKKKRRKEETDHGRRNAERISQEQDEGQATNCTTNPTNTSLDNNDDTPSGKYDFGYDSPATHIFFSSDREEENIVEATTSKDGQKELVKKGKKKPKKKKSRKRKKDPLIKYYQQKYRLFSLFDEGIQIDEEGWYSVTPESIAIHIANRCAGRVVLDAFCGVGGNTIQLAKTCSHVVAIDIDRKRLEMCKNNARVYGVDHKISFILGDFMRLSRSSFGPLNEDPRVDVVFLSPPWGGPAYINQDEFDLSQMPIPGRALYDAARQISPNIAFLLPRNIIASQIAALVKKGECCEIEGNCLSTKVKTMTAYFGDLVLETNGNHSKDHTSTEISEL